MKTHNPHQTTRKAFISALMAAVVISIASCGSSRSYWGVDGTSPDGNIHYTVGSDGRGPGYRPSPPPPHHAKKDRKRWEKEQKKRLKAQKKAAKRFKKSQKHHPHR